MSNRTQKLKLDTPVKAHQVAQVGFEKEGQAFRQEYTIKLDIERTRLLTEAYKSNEADPIVLKRAKGLANVLRNMTIFIRDNELLVGNFAKDLESVTHYPEMQWRWVEKTTAPGEIYSDLLSEEEWYELKEHHTYWKSRSVHGMERMYLPEEMKDAWQLKGQYFFAYQWEHSTPNYEKVFSIGFKGIMQEINDRIASLDKASMNGELNPEDYIDKKNFLTATAITIEATMQWIKRYADLAIEKAKETIDGDRKAELNQIAENCSIISENSPQTLQQALQLYWFIHLIVSYIEAPQVGSGVRLDKLLNPYYEIDAEKNNLTYSEAQELMESLFVKFLETGFLHPPIWSAVGGGGLGWQSVTIGGVDEKGNDVCNDITLIVMDAMASIKAVAPPLSFRWHDNLPQRAIDKVIETLGTGISEPAIFNDKMIIPRLLEMGVPLEDARNFSINNCMYWVVPGKNMVTRSPNGGLFSLPKMLIFALNEGKDFKGNQVSCVTGDSSEFESYEDVVNAVYKHFDFNIERMIALANIGDALYKKHLPRPFLSALLDGCIERAEDCRNWIYNPDYRDVLLLGLNNLSDSLAAIKKVVFEDQKYTLAELIDALKNNWEGYAELKKLCLDAPKFGNDDDYIDYITKDISITLKNKVNEFNTIYGTKWQVDGTAATGPFMLGSMCEATPDGRNHKEPFHDGSISPMPGADTNGPTAVLNSVAKLDQLSSWNHLLNQNFQPEYLKEPYDTVFGTYLKSFGDLGIHHVQFTVAGKEVLMDAQQNPENYPSLLVRVCGYSSYFIDLSKDMQDWIINRTPQCF